MRDSNERRHLPMTDAYVKFTTTVVVVCLLVGAIFSSFLYIAKIVKFAYTIVTSI